MPAEHGDKSRRNAVPRTRGGDAWSDAGFSPTSTAARQANDAISAAFGPGTGTPLTVLGRLRTPVVDAGDARLSGSCCCYRSRSCCSPTLLSDVQRRFRLTGDNLRSVREGLVGTGGVITAAAIVVDATIVRRLLAPATMAVLGNLTR